MKCQFRLRKPLFFPLNYGDDDLEGIDELKGDGQAAIAVRSDLSRGGRPLLRLLGVLQERINLHTASLPRRRNNRDRAESYL